MAKIVKYRQPRKQAHHHVEEEATLYHIRKPVEVADYTFKKFKRIMDMVPFTQSEWANILHLSERTLQRYAKNNSSFEGIYTDRILLLQEMIELGIDTFAGADAFYRWLKRDKQVMGHLLNFESLYSDRGIQEIIDQLERIRQGVYS